jgi:hypothetical protein
MDIHRKRLLLLLLPVFLTSILSAQVLTSSSSTISTSGIITTDSSQVYEGQQLPEINVPMCDPPFNLTLFVHNEGMPGPPDMELVWNEPFEKVFRYDDGVPTGQLGFQGGTYQHVLGAKHSQSSHLINMSWYLTAEGGPHDSVQLYVFGLTAQGLPNSEQLLYTVRVPNTDHTWNTHTFPELLIIDGGFFLGVASIGFVGLATDNGVGAPWVFIPHTHYYSADYTQGNWVRWESSGFPVNGLIRAVGYVFEREQADEPDEASPGRKGENKIPQELFVPTSFPNDLSSLKTIPREEDLLGFNIYRQYHPNPGWELIESLWPETNYILNEPTYRNMCFRVTAVYDSCGESDPSNQDCLYIPAVTELTTALKPHVFPNPAMDLITVETGKTIHAISIINSLGQNVRTYSAIKQSTFTIDVSRLKAGSYTVSVQTTDGTSSVPFIIMR